MPPPADQAHTTHGFTLQRCTRETARRVPCHVDLGLILQPSVQVPSVHWVHADQQQQQYTLSWVQQFLLQCRGSFSALVWAIQMASRFITVQHTYLLLRKRQEGGVSHQEGTADMSSHKAVLTELAL